MLGRRASRLAPPTRAPPVPHCRALPLPRSITPAHYSGGAMGTSRPTAITPAKFACITQVASPRGVVSSHPFLARATAPCAPPCPLAAPHCRAHHPCGLAVGRDVPIAPHRPVANPCTARAPSPCAPPCTAAVPRRRAHRSCPVAVGHDAWPPGLPARAAAPLTAPLSARLGK